MQVTGFIRVMLLHLTCFGWLFVLGYIMRINYNFQMFVLFDCNAVAGNWNVRSVYQLTIPFG